MQTLEKQIKKFKADIKEMEEKFQIIIDKYKDRIIDKFRMATDDFTKQCYRYEQSLDENSKRVAQAFQACKQAENRTYSQSVKLEMMDTKLLEISDDLIAARLSRTYERRITVLENGLSVELQEFKSKQAGIDARVKTLATKEETFQIIYNMGSDLAQNLLLEKQNLNLSLTSTCDNNSWV